LISCGMGNRYGHPSPEILGRLRDEDVQVLRTDLHGAIRVALPANGPMRIHLPGLPKGE
jgi:competence protein ComEC